MIAQGVAQLVRSERVVTWERAQASELLVTVKWRVRLDQGVYVRSLNHP